MSRLKQSRQRQRQLEKALFEAPPKPKSKKTLVMAVTPSVDNLLMKLNQHLPGEWLAAPWPYRVGGVRVTVRLNLGSCLIHVAQGTKYAEVLVHHQDMSPLFYKGDITREDVVSVVRAAVVKMIEMNVCSAPEWIKES